jgi:hypothetical protein
MKNYLEMWKDLFEKYSHKQLLSAFYGALIYTLLIALPFIAAIAQITIVYLYYLTIWIIVIIFIMILLTYIFHFFLLKSLALKKPEFKNNFNQLAIINQMILALVYVMIGLLFIFVFVPLLEV